MEILQLTKLTNLFLSDNELDIFPVAVCHLLMLESLDLSRNEIPVCYFKISSFSFFHLISSHFLFFLISYTTPPPPLFA